MKECKGCVVAVEENGLYKVRLNGSSPGDPLLEAYPAEYPRDRERGWKPKEGDLVVCVYDRDGTAHIVGAGMPEPKVDPVVATDVKIETKPQLEMRPYGDFSIPPLHRLCIYTATVVGEVNVPYRCVTVRLDGPDQGQRTLPSVPVAEAPVKCSVPCDPKWFPQTGDSVTVLLEEVGDGLERHTVVGPVASGTSQDKSLAGIERGINQLASAVDKALSDWRRGALGGK